MKKIVLTMAMFSSMAFADTPTITPDKGKIGDFPPVLEDKPLPPFATILQPLPGVFVVL